MSTENDLTFDESKYKIKSKVILGQAEVPGITKFLLRKGIVKSERQALLLTIILILTMLSATVYIVYTNFFKKPQLPELTPEERLIINQEPNQQGENF